MQTGQAKTCLMAYANNKVADQRAHDVLWVYTVCIGLKKGRKANMDLVMM